MNLTIILAETDEGFPKLFIVSIIFLKTVESLQISDQEKKRVLLQNYVHGAQEVSM
jgi:hypothetical protein